MSLRVFKLHSKKSKLGASEIIEAVLPLRRGDGVK